MQLHIQSEGQAMSPTCQCEKSAAESCGQDVFSFRILHEFPDVVDEHNWRTFLSRADWPSHYTAPEFFLEPFWSGKRPFAILAMRDSKIVAVLTGLHEGNSTVSGLSARPQTCFDPATDYSRAASVLARGLLEEAGQAKSITIFSFISMLSIKQNGFGLRALEGNVVLELSQGVQTLYKQLHENRRRNIRQAIKQGVEVFEASSKDEIAAYYDVYCHWRQTDRKKIDGDQVSFPVVAEAYKLRDSRRLFLARHAGKVIAGTSVRFLQGGLIEYAGNSSLDEYTSLKPNDLLIWKTIEWACANGFLRYSLGGAHPFLRKTGGAIVPIYRHRLDRTWLRRMDLKEAAEDTARNILRKMPLVNKTVRRLVGKS
jgi:hypothetical protein